MSQSTGNPPLYQYGVINLLLILLLVVSIGHPADAFLVVAPSSLTSLLPPTTLLLSSRTALNQSVEPTTTSRSTLIQTAQGNGIAWQQQLEWIQERTYDAYGTGLMDLTVTRYFPAYYQNAAFHEYELGNLCWEAAWEQEIASRAEGARDFPTFGEQGEDVFRGALGKALIQAGACIPNRNQAVVVDLGCGTGLSARQLAITQFPCRENPTEQRTFDQVIGLDLSPYYIGVGQTLLDLAPVVKRTDDVFMAKNAWIHAIDEEMKQKVQLHVADAADTTLETEIVDVVQLLFVLHELPVDVAAAILTEAHRILKVGGQLWVGEIDFQAPASAAQHANDLLFSSVCTTEPYLDQYADTFASQTLPTLTDLFDIVTIEAATGRHYAMVATKRHPQSIPGKCDVQDHRFFPNGDYAIQDAQL